LIKKLVVLFLAAFFLAGLSYGSTLPVASGNQWVYSYRNAAHGSGGTDIPGLGSGTHITTEGILILTMGAVTRHSDSTFFSTTYSDSGFYTYHYYDGMSGRDTSVDSAYKGSCVKDYLAVNGAIYQVGFSGAWLEHDIQLTYTPQNDSTYATFMTYYSRKTTPVVVHVGPDSAEGYKKVFTSTFGNGGMGMTNYSYKDTLCWSDKFGTVLNDTGWTSSFYSEDGGSTHSFSSRYVLLSFRNIPTGIANQTKGSSTSFPLLHPSAARKAVMIYPAMKSVPGIRLFSLTGRQLPNRIGRQILILAP
jgi:hypothetical protein